MIDANSAPDELHVGDGVKYFDKRKQARGKLWTLGPGLTPEYAREVETPVLWQSGHRPVIAVSTSSWRLARRFSAQRSALTSAVTTSTPRAVPPLSPLRTLSCISLIMFICILNLISNNILECDGAGVPFPICPQDANGNLDQRPGANQLTSYFLGSSSLPPMYIE